MRKTGSVSIKQLNATTTTDDNGTTTTTISGPSVVNDVGDVETVITTLINNDTIIDADDVNGLIDIKLQDYTTKTLLTNTLDNYTSKELLTQSLSDRPTFTITDALNTTTTNHENRISAIENNFVSTTSLVEILTPQQQQVNTALAGKANSTHTHLINDLNYDSSNSLKSVIDNKASVIHTHKLSDITDYTATDLSNVEEDINELTEQVLAIETALDGKANSTHTHSISDLNYDSSNTLKSVIDNKASSAHTHSISNITDLQNTLNGKASSSHTHTLSQITDYAATDLSNCAKLNAANYFSGFNTFTRTLKVENAIEQIDGSMEAGEYLSHFIGDGLTAKRSGRIYYCYGGANALNNSYLGIGLYEGNATTTALKCFVNKVEFIKTITAPAITLNGTDLQTTLTNCAKLNAANTFTATQSISTTSDVAFKILNSDLATTKYKSLVVGKSADTTNCAELLYQYNTTENSKRVKLGFYKSDSSQLNIYPDHSEFNKSLTVPSLTLNGTDLQTTLNNCAKTNTANTFTGNQNIKGALDVSSTSVFTGNATFGNNIIMNNANPIIDMTGGTSGMLRIKCGTSDAARFYANQTATNSGYLEIATADDANEPIYVRQYTANNGDHFAKLTRTLTLLDASGNTSIPGILTVPAITLNGTDLSTTLSNCAKLSAQNTFTQINTFQMDVNVLDNNLTSGYSKIMNIGKNMGNIADCGQIKYMYDSTLANRYMQLNLCGYQGLKLYNNKIVSELQLSAPAITLNGSDVITAYNPAYSTLRNGGALSSYIKIGEDATNHAFMQYDKYVDSYSASYYYAIGLKVNDGIKSSIYFTESLIDFILLDDTIGRFNTSGLVVQGTCTAMSHPTMSDRRLKENIEELNNSELIDKVKVYSFNLKNEQSKRKHYGVIAQELQEIAPELIYDDGSEQHILSVNYTELIPHLINKVKSQQKQINELNEKMDKLYELLGITN